MEKKQYELVINEELKKVAPPLMENELELLREDIIEHGCKFPLIVWDDTIVDGHNRYSICRETGIPFAIEQMDFDSIEDAKLWIVKNQLGRRNLKDFQRCEMVFPFETMIKERVKKRMSPIQREQAPPILAGVDSRDILANMAGVSHGTYEKARFIITEGNDEMLEQLRSGKSKIHSVYIKLKKQFDSDEEPESDEKPKIEEEKEEQQDREPEEYEPMVHMEEPLECPPMRDKPEREPKPFPYVKDQVRFSLENLYRNLEIAMNWLRDEDRDKVEILINMLNDGFDRSKSMMKEEEK